MKVAGHAHLRSALESWIPRGSEVALTDVPVNRNAGDLFILAVAVQLLADLDCRIVYRAGVRDYRTSIARRCVGRDTILVGLGGGNLGDLYPRYQALREKVVADFPAHRIVVLPQTVRFESARAQDRAMRCFADHRDLRIAVRDRTSLEIARRFTTHVELLPDLVHELGVFCAPQPGIAPAAGTLLLMRRDLERASHQPAGGPDALDWPDVFPDLSRRVATAAVLMAAAPSALSSSVHARWAGYARELLARGLDRMSRARDVRTDRLHAAILARLADRPVTLFDNSYGKLTAYYETWWRDDPAVELANRV